MENITAPNLTATMQEFAKLSVEEQIIFIKIVARVLALQDLFHQFDTQEIFKGIPCYTPNEMAKYDAKPQDWTKLDSMPVDDDDDQILDYEPVSETKI